MWALGASSSQQRRPWKDKTMARTLSVNLPWAALNASLLFGLSFFFHFKASTVHAAEGLTPKSRMAILRGLIAEYGTARVPLPLGEKGVSLSTAGELDQ